MYYEYYLFQSYDAFFIEYTLEQFFGDDVLNQCFINSEPDSEAGCLRLNMEVM